MIAGDGGTLESVSMVRSLNDGLGLVDLVFGVAQLVSYTTGSSTGEYSASAEKSTGDMVSALMN